MSSGQIIELQPKRSTLKSMLNLVDVTVKISIPQELEEYELAVKIDDGVETVVKQSATLHYESFIDYYEQSVQIIYFYVVNSKGKRLDKASAQELILNDYYACEDEPLEYTFECPGQQITAELLVTVQKTGAEDQESSYFVSLNSEEQKQAYLKNQMQVHFPNISFCCREPPRMQVSEVAEMLKVVSEIFPGMADDFNSEKEELTTLNMYYDMLLQAVQANEAEVLLDVDYCQKVTEMFDALFLSEQNVMLEKDILIIPLNADNQSTLLLQSILSESFSKTHFLIPIFIREEADINELKLIVKLVNVIYNLFHILLGQANSDSSNISLQQFVLAEKEINLSKYNKLLFGSMESIFIESLNLKEYQIEKSFASNSYIKILLLDEEENTMKTWIFEYLEWHNQESVCNSLRETEYEARNTVIDKILTQAISIVENVAKLMRIPVTQILPSSAYVIPIPPESILQMLEEYSLNSADTEKYAELIYLLPCQIGSVSYQLSRASSTYAELFCNEQWVYAIFCLLHCSPETQNYKIAFESVKQSIMMYLNKESIIFLEPLLVVMQAKNVYLKDKVIQPKPFNEKPIEGSMVQKLIKQKQSVELFESLKFLNCKDIKCKYKLYGSVESEEEYECDNLSRQLIVNELGKIQIFDYCDSKCAEKLSSKVFIKDFSAHLYYDDLKDDKNLLAIGPQFNYYIYEKNLKSYENAKMQFLVNKNEYMEILIDGVKQLNVDELIIEKQKSWFILLSSI